MPKLTDTYARAYDCCDQVFMELGRFPTIDLIRDRIGVNSPTTIKKAMNEWTRHFAEKHFDKLNRPDVPAALAHAMEQAWKLAVVEAEQAYLKKEQGYQNTIAENQAVVAELQQAMAFVNQTLGQARAQLEQREQQINVLQQQFDEQTRLAGQLREQLSVSEKDLEEQHRLLQAQEQRRQQQQDQDQDQDQAWFARRISEEKQYMEEKWHDKVQQQQQQIALLSASEATLQALCANLRREQLHLQEALALAQTPKPDAHRFKLRRQPDKVPDKGRGR
ncbi:MAG: DNA-binding protein [Methylovulum sp.]|nr:MAG: DNA-binding protein [Methylovulum sp.]